MDGGLDNKWLMDSGCSRHMTSDKKWFSILTPLSHKGYVTFGDDKKGKVLGSNVMKVNNNFTLKGIALMEKLRYTMLSISQLVDADLDVLFHKSSSKSLQRFVGLGLKTMADGVMVGLKITAMVW
jgi:hypothetical protein